MTSLETIRQLENQIECAHQHLEDLWDDRQAAIKEFLSNHSDWIQVNYIPLCHYLMAPEMKNHLVDYTYNLLSKEKGFTYEEVKEVVKQSTHPYGIAYFMLKGELMPKHLMVRYVDYLKREHPDCVLDLAFMLEESKEDKEI